MRVEWLLLAESVAQDGRGALAVIGLNQNVFAPDTLPAMLKRAIIARIVDAPENVQVHFRFDVLSPSGRTLSVQEGDLQLGARLLADLPGSFDIPVEFMVAANEVGEYRVQFEASLQGAGAEKSVEGSVSIYVVNALQVRPNSYA